jgi:hypothetical protein
MLAIYLVVLGALVFLPFGRGMDLGDRLIWSRSPRLIEPSNWGRGRRPSG